MSNKLRLQQGFTLVEAVVAISVFAIGILALVQVTVIARASSDAARDTVQVSNYLQEGVEAVRIIRDSAWTNVNTDGSYHLVAQAGLNPPWQLVAAGTETIGKYNRSVTLAAVSRQDTDGSGTLTAGDKIVTSGGTLPDPDTKRVTVTITWNNGSKSYTKSLNEYITNWHE